MRKCIQYVICRKLSAHHQFQTPIWFLNEFLQQLGFKFIISPMFYTFSAVICLASEKKYP